MDPPEALFATARRLFEDTFRSLPASDEAFLSGRDYDRQLANGQALLKIAEAFQTQIIGVALGRQPASALGHPGEGALNFTQRFLRTPSVDRLPAPQRDVLKCLVESEVLLGFATYCLLLRKPESAAPEEIDADWLTSRLAPETLIADVIVQRRLGETYAAATAMFARHWETVALERISAEFKVGLWAKGKWRSYFRNIFCCGLLLGIYIDGASDTTSRAPEQPRSTGALQPVDLRGLRQGFVGRRYAELVEYHLGKMKSKQALLASSVGTMQLLPEAVRAMCEQIVDDWNLRAYDPLFWQRDCASVFDEIIDDMRERLSIAGMEPDDEALFNLFQMITLAYAYFCKRSKAHAEVHGDPKGPLRLKLSPSPARSAGQLR